MVSTGHDFWSTLRQAKGEGSAMRVSFLLGCAGFLMSSFLPGEVAAQDAWTKVKANWRVSCGVDSGAYHNTGDTHVFAPSRNQCSGGIYQQRSELTSSNFDIRKAQTLLLDATIQFQAPNSDNFTIFQVHSEQSREGCAPPLALNVKGDGRLEFFSDYSRSSRTDFCVANRSLRSARHTGPRLRRDGVAQKLQVAVAFDGRGGFTATVYIDGQQSLSGSYTPNTASGFVPLSTVYFKHGVYSPKRWDYRLVSQGLRLLRR